MKAISLRSRKGGFDVAKLAEKYGGGGHQSAASFKNKEVFDRTVKTYLDL
jgi:nanoRNase/pAp phosphatase (c-di-AMP/oligoRNAs hydrolase)